MNYASYFTSTWFKKGYMVRLRLTNIDDNSPRHPYLFETKPLKLSLIKNFDSSDECNSRNDITHKQMLSLNWEGDCGCSQAKIPNVVFWGRKNTGSTFWYRFWATAGNFFISKNLVYCLISYKNYIRVTFQFRCSSI